MKALIIYDNFTSAARANAALQQSVQNADCAVEWDIVPWRMDMLKFPPTSGEALADASDAHLIMFVGCCAELLPFWLQDWLEQWAKCRLIEDAALAVIGETSMSPLSISPVPELSRFANRYGLSLIFDDNRLVADGRSTEDRMAFTENLVEYESTLPAILPQTLDVRTRNAYRGWGIND